MDTVPPPLPSWKRNCPSGAHHYCSDAWSPVPDGDPITTPAARLLPVLLRGEPGMLKLSCEEEERHGGVLMEWWDGEGAARVLARDETALLAALDRRLDRFVSGLVPERQRSLGVD
jgi:streptomycin 6-kinase